MAPSEIEDNRVNIAEFISISPILTKEGIRNPLNEARFMLGPIFVTSTFIDLIIIGNNELRPNPNTVKGMNIHTLSIINDANPKIPIIRELSSDVILMFLIAGRIIYAINEMEYAIIVSSIALLSPNSDGVSCNIYAGSNPSKNINNAFHENTIPIFPG